MNPKYKYLILIPFVGLLFPGCKKLDNYPAPSSGIYGTLTDAETGDPVILPVGEGTIRMLEQNSLYPNPTPIGIPVNSKSAYYSTQLFADQYKVFPLALSGPFIYPSMDTVLVTLNQNSLTEVNFQVTPYYRIAASISDTTFTYTITSSLANDSLGSNLTNVYFLISADSALNMGTAGNPYGGGSYYPNQFPLSGVSNAMLGVQQTFSIPFSVTRLSPGTYYFRISCQGSNSDGQYNYSQTLESTVD